ncbi:hypothetical protein AQUSIP_23160 [Aquicella siphonis]|uniref:N-acetyltransferase domain-containing protein n=1 Tax=Aquicella siphonis TaxID=254247 RepID=A0A5E4PIU7_9COXI|nr:bifunctional GrpB family protein/GNAT family N-acetyltransferase [Aquicella siphonis]VVC76989.1 hypothetical protein AQUSIP_23160 [Aquicella siphonis]
MSPRIVELIPYQQAWSSLYLTESGLLRQTLSSRLRSVYHIGSTAIPGMAAKPVIDILVEYACLDDMHAIEQALAALGYDCLRKNIVPHTSFFTSKQNEAVRYHLHLFPEGDPQVKRHVAFRDYLIRHPQEYDRYQRLKQQLAARYRDNIHEYVKNKSQTIQDIDSKAKRWIEQRIRFLPPDPRALIKEWTQDKILLAMEANLNVHMTHFSQYMKTVQLIRVPDFTIVNSGLQDDTFNYVVRADFSARDACSKIREVNSYFDHGSLPFTWWVSPHDQPRDLACYLERSGYQNTENNPAMWLDLESWHGDLSGQRLRPPAELSIVRALDQQTLLDFARVLNASPSAFDQYYIWLAEVISAEDPIEYYVGYVDNKPVVRGLACYYAGVAGLYWLSVPVAYRRRGYGTAMQQFRLMRAKEMGYRMAVLQASQEGFPLYKRLGYKECGLFREYKLK